MQGMGRDEKESSMSLDGVYEVVTKSPMGDQKGTLTVKTDGESWTGNQAGPTGTIDITDGVVEGNVLKWTAQITVPLPMTLTAEATVEGDDLTGSTTAGAFGTFGMTGKRVG